LGSAQAMSIVASQSVINALERLLIPCLLGLIFTCVLIELTTPLFAADAPTFIRDVRECLQQFENDL
jgi:hypothetical protein